MTRREWLAISAAVSASPVLAFPVPMPRLPPPAPLLPPNDAPKPLPEGAFRRLGSRRFRTGRGISRLQFSPHGKVIVAADRDEIRAWEVATAKPILSMPYPEKVDLNSGRVTTRDTIVALARVENEKTYEIHHYEFATGQTKIRTTTNATTVNNASFSADGSRVAVSHNSVFTIYNGGKSGELWTLAMGNEQFGDHFFADGDRLFAISCAEGLRLFDTDTGKERKPLRIGAKDKNVALRFVTASPNGEFVAGITREPGKIFIWRIDRGELIQTIEEKNPGTLFGFSPDGATLHVLKDGTLRAYSVATGKVEREIDLGPLSGATLSPGGDVIAGSPGDSVVLIDVATGKLNPLSADPPGLPTKLAYHAKNKLCGMLNGFGGWIEWNLDTGSSRILRPKVLGENYPVGIARDGRTAVVAAANRIQRWDLAANEMKEAFEFESNRSTALVDVTADGSLIVAAVATGIKVWDTATGKSQEIPGGAAEREGEHIAISDDGSTAVMVESAPNTTRGHTPIVEVYSLRTRAYRTRLVLPNNQSRITLSPNGTLLAVAFNNRYAERSKTERFTMNVIEIATGRTVLKTSSNNAESTASAISPDQRLLAVGVEGTLIVWDLLGGKRHTFKLPGDASSVAFAPDAATLAVACAGGPVLLFDLRNSRQAKPAKACDGLLAALGNADPAIAMEALRLVAAWPGDALPILAKAIPAVEPPDAKALQANIAKLDAPAFAERDRATRELTELGELAAPALRAVLADSGSAEARERAEAILMSGGPSAPANLLAARAVEACEWAANEDARKLLGTWASGAAGARLTSDAAAALKRLN